MIECTKKHCERLQKTNLDHTDINGVTTNEKTPERETKDFCKRMSLHQTQH